MKSKKLWILITLAVGAIALVLVLGLRGGSGASPADNEPVAEEEAPSSPVRVAQLSEMTLPQTISHSGTIEPWERAHVTGQSGARIEHVHVREGERVQRGQVVATMDDSNLRQAEVDLRLAQNEVERMRRLVDIGSVARQQLEQAEAQYETAHTNVANLRRNTELTSPISGVVTDKYFVDGEQFMAGAETPSIVTVQQMNPLKVVINVSERHFPAIRAGVPATVRLDTYGDRAFDGQVTQVNPTVSPDSRTFRVEVRVDNPDGALSPGMFARVRLNLGDVTGQFLPRAAIQTQPGSDEHFVYVVEDGTARRVSLTTGERAEQYQRVLGGLDDDAHVVTEGTGRLSDGSRVRIVE